MGDKKLNQIGGELKTARAKRLSNESLSVDMNTKIKSIEAEKTGYKCCCCGTEYSIQRNNFLRSNSVLFKGNGGYIPICKNCVDNYYLQLVDFFDGNEEHAIEHCCHLFDWYYNTDASAMTKESNNGRARVSQYPSKMVLIQIANKGTTYLDTLRDKHSKRILKDEDILQEDNVSGDGEVIAPSRETVKFFGYGYLPEEYEYLQEQYDDWTSRYDCETKAKEEIFKNLSIAQLAVQRAQKEKNQKETASAIKTFQDLLGTANIKPSQDKEVYATEQETFGTFIKMIENTRPISEPKEEWKDVDGIIKQIDTFFVGQMADMLHLNNEKADEYRKEKEKYTVYPPTYDEEDGGDTSILDKYSDRSVKTDE